MRFLTLLRLLIAVSLVAVMSFVPLTSATATTATFFHTGAAQQFTVPAGVTSISVDALGAEGESSLASGGQGGQAMTTFAVTPGDIIQVMVGGQGNGNGGFNGGGDAGLGFGFSGAGGGASDIRMGACAATLTCGNADRVLVAGGGGGSEGAGFHLPAIGGAGGLTGGDGTDPAGFNIYGTGATGAAGGNGGGNGSPGVFGQGGNGGDGLDPFDEGGGGGGGGYYGGGGGGGGDVNGINGDPSGGNAGGGSSYGPVGTTFNTGVHTGDGIISITYTGLPPATATGTTLVADGPNPAVHGEAVTFTATVTPTPSGGSVQFRVDGLDVGAPVAVDGFGEATSAPMSGLALGSRSVEALYSGDPSFLASASPVLTFTVDPASSSTLLVSSPATVAVGSTVTYTATVAAGVPSATTATGTVSFTDDTAPIGGCGAVVLDGSEQATCTTTATSPGVHSIEANYAGVAEIQPSSAQMSLTVDPAPVTTTTAPPTTAPATTAPPTAPPTTAPATTAPPTTAAPVVTASPAPATTAPSSIATVPVTPRPPSRTPASTATTTTTVPSTTTAPDEAGGSSTTTTSTSTTTTTAPAEQPEPAEALADVRFSVDVDDTIEGATAEVTGEGFLADSAVAIVMFSDPIELGRATTAPDGSFATTVVLPAGLEPGSHRIEVSGFSGQNEPVTYTWYLALDDDDQITRLELEPLAEPPGWYAAGDLAFVSPEDFLPEYVVTEHAPTVVATMVSGFALLTIISGAGSFGGGGATATAFSGKPDSGRGPGSGSSVGSGSITGTADNAGFGIAAGAGAAAMGSAGATAAAESAAARRRKRKLGGAGAEQHLIELDATEVGDRSPTWRFRPLSLIVDHMSVTAPSQVSTKSPLFARILTDGIHLRAMFGSLSLLAPIVGLILGFMASNSVAGAPLPPTTALVIAIVALSAFDAFAGVCAAATYTVMTLLGGDVNSVDAVRGLLGVNLVFFAVALIAAKARPLRRELSTTNAEHFDRVADVVIASLIGAWAMKKLIGALPGLTGLEVPIADQADTVALVALGALALRWALETTVMWWYPMRLGAVSPAELPTPGDGQKLAALGLQTFLFVFMAYAFLGNVWELWAGAALFVVPQLVDMRKDKLPNAPWLVRLLPGGIVKVTVMLVIGTYFSVMVKNQIDDPARFITLGFVLLSIPGLVLTAFGFFGRDGKKWEQNWFTRLGGVGVLVIAILLVEGIITLG